MVLSFKLLNTCAVVVGVSLAVARLGPRLGGILAGLPIVLGPGYFFLLRDESTEFVREAALSTLHALIATLVFSLVFVLLAHRLRIALTLGAATLAWVPVAVIMMKLPGGVPVAIIGYLLMLGLADWVSRLMGLKPPQVVAVGGWWDLIARGLLAGLLVSIATTVATRAGPGLSGLLVGFPVGLFTISWTLYERYGSEIARATVTAAQTGMLSLVAFAALVALTAGRVPAALSFSMALAASCAVSGLLFGLSQWRSRQQRSMPVEPRTNSTNKETPL